MNPRQMKQAMRKMGIKSEEVPDVEEVLIRTADREIVVERPAVTLMEMQGQKTYQVVGDSFERARGEAGEQAPAVDEEDIELVMSQTGCGRDAALKALTESGGQPAEAIISIISSR